MGGLDFNRGAKRAREAREKLGLGPIEPLACLLDAVESAGFPVAIVGLPARTAGACTQYGETRLLWVNGTQPHNRQRFTLAHELGHAWCGHDGTLVVDTFETLGGTTTDANELQANAFAGEFLIPKQALGALAGREVTLDEVVVVAAHFGTSAQMTLVRLRQAAIVSQTRYEEIAGEIAEKAHFAAWERLGCVGVDDRLASLGRRPYLSPALRETHLGALFAGEAAAGHELTAVLGRLTV